MLGIAYLRRVTERRRGSLIWCLIGLMSYGCSSEKPLGSDRPVTMPEKRIMPVVWDTVFYVESTLEDTLLERPAAVTADAGGVTVLDFGASRVLRFDRSGTLIWSWGQVGSGPNELRAPRELHLGPGLSHWIYDPQNLRIVVLDTAGAVVQRIPLQSAMLGMTALPAGDKIVVLNIDPTTPFIWLDTAGTLFQRAEAPAPYLRRLDPLHVQMLGATDPTTGRWAAALSVHDGFFIFEASGALVSRGWYVDPPTPPRIETRTRTTGPGQTSTVRRVSPESAAGAITLSPTRLYVVHTGDGRARRIDSYAIDNGTYVESFELPFSVSDIAYHDGCFFTLSSRPIPRVIGLCPKDARL